MFTSYGLIWPRVNLIIWHDGRAHDRLLSADLAAVINTISHPVFIIWFLWVHRWSSGIWNNLTLRFPMLMADNEFILTHLQNYKALPFTKSMPRRVGKLCKWPALLTKILYQPSRHSVWSSSIPNSPWRILWLLQFILVPLLEVIIGRDIHFSLTVKHQLLKSFIKMSNLCE